MEHASFKTSAPGSLMLLGEHAVLYGKRAIACAVDQRVYVSLRPRSDSQVHIHSTLASYESQLDNLIDNPKLRFVLASIRFFLAKLPSGFDLNIQSDFSHLVGLGSSAAVTVAVMGAFYSWLGSHPQKEALLAQCIQIIHQVQGRGSGADAAASIFGGKILYKIDPLEVYSFPYTCPLTLVYCGYKTPTIEVIHKVSKIKEKFPFLLDAIFSAIDDSVSLATEAIEHQRWNRLGEILNINHGMMSALGVSNLDLEKIIYSLRASPTILGAKISGSGLGDCVIGLGHFDQHLEPYQILPIKPSQDGLRILTNE